MSEAKNWDKVFPKSENVNIQKVTFKMAEKGYIALAFDPSYTGESGGEPRHVASPDIIPQCTICHA